MPGQHGCQATDKKLQFSSAHHFPHLHGTLSSSSLPLLASSSHTNVQALLSQNSGLIPQLVELLINSNDSFLQAEACTVIASISGRSSEHALKVVQCGAFPVLVNLMKSSSHGSSVQESATLALANIIGQVPSTYDTVNPSQVLSSLLRLVNINKPVSFLRQVESALQNFCSLDMDLGSELFFSLHQLIHHYDHEIVEKACCILASSTRNSRHHVQCLIDASLVPRLGELLTGPTEGALQTLANVASLGTELQRHALVDCGILPSFHQLLTSPRSSPHILRETIGILDHICSSSSSLIQAVIDSGLIEPLLELLEKTNYHGCQLAAAKALYNISVSCTQDQVMYLVSAGVLPALCNILLYSSSSHLVILALQTLDTLLERVGQEERRSLCCTIEELGAIDSIEALQHHDDIEIYHAAHDLLSRYFPCVEAPSAVPTPDLDECGNAQPSPQDVC